MIDSEHAHYLGAEKKSNNTGELSGVAEALLWLRDEEGATGRRLYVTIRPTRRTSVPARSGPQERVDLAKTCRDLYCSEGTRRKRKLALEHVKGHSGGALNERADALVQRGVAERASVGVARRRRRSSSCPLLRSTRRRRRRSKNGGSLLLRARRQEARAMAVVGGAIKEEAAA